MKQLDDILARLDEHYSLWAKCDTSYMQADVEEAKQAIQALMLDIIGEDYPKDYPYDDPEAIKYFNIEKERQRAKLKEMK